METRWRLITLPFISLSSNIIALNKFNVFIILNFVCIQLLSYQAEEFSMGHPLSFQQDKQKEDTGRQRDPMSKEGSAQMQHLREYEFHESNLVDVMDTNPENQIRGPHYLHRIGQRETYQFR